MATKEVIEKFMNAKSLAVVGVSRNQGKFGNAIFKDLKARGYKVYPVNPKADTVEGEKCYPTLASLPQKPEGVVFVVPPAQTEKMVDEVIAQGINQVWLQQGSESVAAVQKLKSNGTTVIEGLCIMMFMKDRAFFHSFHRWIMEVFGALYKKEA